MGLGATMLRVLPSVIEIEVMCAALRPVFKGSDSPFFTCPCWVKWDLLCQAPKGRQTRTEERLLTLKYRYQPQISLTKKERNTMDQPPSQKLCWYSAGITPVLCGYICVLLGAVNLTHQWMKTTFNSFSSWKTEVQSGCHTIKWFSIKVLAGLGTSESFRREHFFALYNSEGHSYSSAQGLFLHLQTHQRL